MRRGSMVELVARERDFRRLWLGQCVSQAGDWFQLVALVSLLPTKGGGVHALGLFFLVRFLPPVVWTAVGGVVADRFPRKVTMVTADLGRALVVLGYLFARGPEDLWLVLALVFVQETLTAFYEPARGASIPQVVSSERLYAANTLGSATWSAMLALGSALGGGVVAWLGTRAAFVINGASFVLSASLVASARIPKIAPLEAPSSRPRLARIFGLDDLADGVAYLRGHAPQATVSLLKSGIGIIAAGAYVLIAVFTEQIFAASMRPELATGYLYATRGLGSLVGPLVVERLFGTSPRALRLGILGGYFFGFLGFSGFALAPTVPWAIAAYAVAASSTSAVWVNSTQLLQLTVDNRFLGRVLGVELMAISLVMMLSTVGTSTVLGAGWLGPRGAALAVAGATLLPFFAWAALTSRFGPRLDAAAERRA